jgi:hypothetical protein
VMLMLMILLVVMLLVMLGVLSMWRVRHVQRRGDLQARKIAR